MAEFTNGDENEPEVAWNSVLPRLSVDNTIKRIVTVWIDSGYWRTLTIDEWFTKTTDDD